jgi:hypothetical protein
MGSGCSESHASTRVQQPVACSSESSFKGFYQSSLGEHTQTPGAAPRKDSRIPELRGRVNELAPGVVGQFGFERMW